MKFGDWTHFSTWLESRGMFHMELGLERMHKALALLNLERLPFKVIHVLGTNGKGSTCAFLASLCRENGIKAGLYTSPHFISPRERILVDGCEVAKEFWLDAANEIFSVHKGEPDLTYFEFLTVMAIFIFRDVGVEMAILEAGLGGKNDATTAIQSEICIFTPISLDHTQILGHTLENVAADKGAAIAENSRVFSAYQKPAVRRILKKIAHDKKASIEFVPPLPASWHQFLGMRGQIQFTNAALALAAMEYALSLLKKYIANTQACLRGLARAFMPGRLQIIPATTNLPCFILDGAHNPHGTKCLVLEFAQKKISFPAALIFSCLEDKDWQTSLTLLLRQFRSLPFLIPQLANKRAMDACSIAAFCNKRHPGRAKAYTGSMAFRDAISKAADFATIHKRPVLITGSLYLLADFYGLYPQFLIPTPACCQ